MNTHATGFSGFRGRWAGLVGRGLAAGVFAALALAACASAAGGGSGEIAPPPRTPPAGADTVLEPGHGEAPTPAPTQQLPDSALVIFGGDTIRADVADTPEERERGLMGRESLAPDAGMLFVYDEPGYRSFWMQDTLIPLDLAFFDAALRVVEIVRMEPETTELHSSAEPAVMALEVNQGWFEEHGVEEGDFAEVVWLRR